MLDAPQPKPETDIFEDTKLLIKFLLLLISLFSRPSEAFLRYRFGERYFSLFPVLSTALIIHLFVVFNTATNSITGADITSIGVLLFSYAFVAMSLYHRFVIIKGEFKGDYEVYSFQPGYSRDIWYRIFKDDGILNRLFPYFVQRAVEPAFVFIIGSIIIFFDTALGIFLQLSAFCLLIQEAIAYRYRRIEYLNQKDARLLAKYNYNLEEEFNQKKPETAEIVQTVSSL